MNEILVATNLKKPSSCQQNSKKSKRQTKSSRSLWMG